MTTVAEQLAVRARPTHRARAVFSYPDPVNEVSARAVAAGVLVLALVTAVTSDRWLALALAGGFVARVLTGPTLSPLGQFATRVVTPLLPARPRFVSGPPKRFAQGIGATFSVTATALAFGGWWIPAQVVLSLLASAALLESAAGFCLGCSIFGMLIRKGIVPEAVCARCADISAGPASCPSLIAVAPSHASRRTPA
jgi:hypothetical protein